ncbi:hypothetical protein [Clostridium perfringens]|uniref:hypothetical protein n=1 Tax=Clostridium perfringens TaxID=1502 RepID=UPI0011591942|nr:hypothetical protein [Clostridium perfringens]EHK2362421.1 hypothetical protein [Clostridium perfringens]EHR1329496.1 hypothetical protein [Clostridium perfringens]EHR1332582.1 hypothetical protein [Clostridium perfringens]EHR1426162.1 hypothetical protein [Clostridium perfringens]EIF6164930.1 hypothetical protein [Clostridium perfringens]
MSDISNIMGVITGTIGAITGIGGLFFSWKTNKDVNRPKIKFNLNKIQGREHLNYYNLYIENISDYNLYDFSVQLENIEEIVKSNLIEHINILKEDIPVFTIGQVYESYLFNATDCKGKVDYMNFIVRYRLKENGKVRNEKYLININALRNLAKKIEEKQAN